MIKRVVKPKFLVPMSIALVLIVTQQNCLKNGSSTKSSGVRNNVVESGNGGGYGGKVYTSVDRCPDGSPRKQIVQPENSDEFIKIHEDCREVEDTKVSVNKTDPTAIGTDLITHEGSALVETEAEKVGGYYCKGMTDHCGQTPIPLSYIEVIVSEDSQNAGKFKYSWRIDNCRVVVPVIGLNIDFTYFETWAGAEHIGGGVYSDAAANLEAVVTLRVNDSPPTVQAEWDPFIDMFYPLSASYQLDSCVPLKDE